MPEPPKTDDLLARRLILVFGAVAVSPYVVNLALAALFQPWLFGSASTFGRFGGTQLVLAAAVVLLTALIARGWFIAWAAALCLEVLALVYVVVVRPQIWETSIGLTILNTGLYALLVAILASRPVRHHVR